MENSSHSLRKIWHALGVDVTKEIPVAVDPRAPKSERAVSMNPYHYAHEKIGAALASLLLPGVEFEKRLAGAMAELCIAFYVTSPPPPSGKLVEKIKEMVGTGLWQERARTLTPAERSEVVTVFWELDRAVSREYYMFEARREVRSNSHADAGGRADAGQSLVTTSSRRL